MTYEFTAFCMVLYKAIEFVQGRRLTDGLTVRSDPSTSNLITVLYRDALIYFAGYVPYEWTSFGIDQTLSPVYLLSMLAPVSFSLFVT